MVSIIIATYNSEKTLRRAMNSVLNQDYQDWECIVVDGASKDGTIGIVKEFVAKDPRFRYISEPDKGIYDAFNKGWKMAKGEWVMYLGSDDEYTKEGIKALMENSDGADVVYGDTYFREANSNKMRLQQSSPVKMGGFCCHQSLAMKKTVISELSGFDEQYKILADKDLVCKTIKMGANIRQIHLAISIFSLDGVSTTSFQRYIESFRVNRKYLPFMKCVLYFICNTSKYFIKRMLGK